MRRAGPSVVYLGFNDPRLHIRGTENVVRFQAAATAGRAYYLFRGHQPEAFRWGRLVAVAIPLNYFAAPCVLRRLIRRITQRHGTPPIIHGHNYLLSLLVTGAPLVFTVHDALSYAKRESGSRLVRIFQVIEFLVYLRSKSIHSISRFTWDQAICKRFFSPRVRIIYNTNPQTTHDSALSGTKQKSGAIKYYLIVRSIEPRANIDLVLDVAERLLTLEPETEIRVVGKGPLLDHYRALSASRELLNISFLGYVDDIELEALYRGAACVIMPALYGEGFGLPLIEAYAKGIPAIGSNVCAVPEVIASPNLLFENSVESVLAALAAARALQPEALVAHYRQNFDRTLILDQYRQFYSSIEPRLGQ